MDPSLIYALPPDQLYSLYLKVWGQGAAGIAAALGIQDLALADETGAYIVDAMSKYAAAGFFTVAAENNKYYPIGKTPANWTPVPVDPSNPNGPVTYIPTGPSIAVTPPTPGTPAAPPATVLAGLTTGQLILYGVLAYFGLKALGVIR